MLHNKNSIGFKLFFDFIKGAAMPGTPVNRDFKVYPACIFMCFQSINYPESRPDFIKT